MDDQPAKCDPRMCAANGCSQESSVVFLIHERVELPRCARHADGLRSSLSDSLPAHAWREAKPPAKE